MDQQLSLFNQEINFNDLVTTDTIDSIKFDRKLNVVSLFSGCGGMDLGFLGDFSIFGKYYERNPFEVVFANDILERACLTYTHNLKKKIVCEDIKQLDLSILPEADIVIGGFPCQDFSLAGKQKGLTAERGRLYLEMKKVIEYCRPMAFVAENVDGIRNKTKKRSISPLEVILNDFREIGYDVEYKTLNAADYGVPQNRIRVIIIGIKSKWNIKVKFPKITNEKEKWITAKEAIDDLWDKIDKEAIKNHTTKDYSKAKFYYGKKMQGNCKIEANKPAPTIRAEHHGNIEGHYRTMNEKKSEDIKYWRRLSVRECARLQSFPDTFEFPCSASSAYKQIGNAVPPILAWHIARSLYHTLKPILET